MTTKRIRVLILCSHPVQYAAPMFRRFAKDPRLDIQVAYCCLNGAERTVDREFGVPVAWDVPLTDGYAWTRVANWSPAPGIGRFWGLLNPGVWKLIRKGRFDAVIVYTGYMYATFWLAAAAARISSTPVLFGIDANQIEPLDGNKWKLPIKRRVWRGVFQLVDVVLVVSTGGLRLVRSFGIPDEHIVLTPYAVENDWWLAQAERVDREEIRRNWGVPPDAVVVLFCAKLQAWKRPQDVLQAFAREPVRGAYLVYVGEGPMRAGLESEARTLGIADRVRFLGFVNQSGLPAVYRSADILVLPSEYDAFGVVVNEAMLCGCPAIVSDRVGARFDLVREGETGFIFPSGDVGALSSLLRQTLVSPDRLRLLGRAARRRMETWSPAQNLEATVVALERAVRFRHRNADGA
jgi:glycosyltransferase involved in cell wall biosynthesis